SANGVIGESWPPQTIIWSVPSIRVKTADCAVRAVGTLITEMGAQLSAKTADAISNKAKHETKRGSAFVVKINGFIWFFLLFFIPAELILWNCGSGRGEEPSGGNVLHLIQIRLATPSFARILSTCQAESPCTRVADSSSRNAVSFSSARPTKRFP